MTGRPLWKRYLELCCECPETGLVVDPSRMDLPEGWLDSLAGPMERAFQAMGALEGGALANPDEQRMVGHYWLRAPLLAPSESLRGEIEEAQQAVLSFAGKVHAGEIAPERGGRFERLLLVGIGGSALGPQLAADALAPLHPPMDISFLDNTDPDGFERVLGRLGQDLARTLTVVVSKSGGTKETRNGMLEAAEAYRRAGLSFPLHAVAVTGEGSGLDCLARDEGWLARFPMWDWVGGRTSICSAVGLLPMALQGIDVLAFLEGARRTDALTRVPELRKNPAALLAACWLHATGGKGEKDMVVLPYKDRLLLFSRYLQQLVMESLGKELDLEGGQVHQGIAVYGNKGSTDQHAFVQQLREGVNNFFVIFVEVLEDREEGAGLEVDPGITSGDYLAGFYLGTRRALHEKGRASLTVTLDRLDAAGLGSLVALFERAVGFYASLVGINAYHQPGVEAGKKAAAEVLDLQRRTVTLLEKWKGEGRTAGEIADGLDAADEVETVYHLLRHLVANRRHGIHAIWAERPDRVRFLMEE
jgi:glucose-6-phosphate isomerase